MLMAIRVLSYLRKFNLVLYPKIHQEKHLKSQNIKFNDFTYSKKRHFEIFKNHGLDVKLFRNSVEHATSDLKVYQDLLSFHLISELIEENSKVLEIGGGDSRLLKFFSKTFECWNLDKLEGIGNGPKGLETPGYSLVLDYIGNHNKDLPEDYFDLVFSISALEHVPIGNPTIYHDILTDINRLLKPGGLSFHCIDHTTDLLLGKLDEVWTNPLIEYLFDNQKTLNEFVPLAKAELDPDLFVVREELYREYWQPVTGVSYEDFGRPFSYNIFWKK